jgi:tetratricopeptide (TPR) repeat protein
VKSSYLVFGATGLLVLAGALFFRPAAGADAPRVPTSDGEVLERLPRGATDPREREQERLRALLAAHPEDLRVALALARLDIELSRARSDPRYLSYAQAALGRYWDMESPPSEVLVLRATIRQSVHDFDRALADLDRVVAADPGNAQAWITRSVVLAVKGRYDEAKASCQPLAARPALAPPLVFAVCEASIDSVTGAAGPAYERLGAELGKSTRLSPGENEWAVSIMGEIAERLGHDEDAERAFKGALSIDPGDPYVVSAYADLLLDLGRPAEALALVEGKTENDNLLLRLALAEAKVRAPDAPAHARLLRERFDASHLRGDTVHRREEARFVLALEDDPKAALALAVANWDVQKEPWDVRVLLEAAIAAKEPAAAKPVLDFLDAHHLEDPRILALAARLRPGAK